MTARSVIKQSVVLGAPADRLFAMYLDPRRHAAITGAPVKISRTSGSPFSAFGGSLSGRTLAVVAPRLIVQSWRSTNFGTDDPDSTLILSFSSAGRKGRIDLVQLDVPEVDYAGVSEGWKLYYWTPWRQYLAR
ncbi:MAG: SRPBCC domain-containing protein [Reyranellales bacterium]